MLSASDRPSLAVLVRGSKAWFIDKSANIRLEEIRDSVSVLEALSGLVRTDKVQTLPVPQSAFSHSRYRGTPEHQNQLPAKAVGGCCPRSPQT